MSNLVGYGIPFIFNPKSKEEKIEEARQLGLINENGVPQNQQVICQRCGSSNVIIALPKQDDFEKGVEIPYFCKNCGYEGKRVGKLKTVKNDGTLVMDLIPDQLVGLERYGSFLGQY